jgi:hypothetical protein
MKKSYIVALFVLCAMFLGDLAGVKTAAADETLNMQKIGRNAMGPTHAASVYGSYLVMGNGAYLEIYEIFGTRPFKQKRGRILMPDVIKDIYVDGQTAYVACNGAGLISVDISTPVSPYILGQFNQTQYAPNGRALGVFVFGTNAYVADSLGGLIILNISNPAQLNPPVGIYSAPNTSVRDVFVDLSGSKTVAYVAADTAGLWALDVSSSVQTAPVRLDAIHLNGAAQGLSLSPTIAYVAVGSQGLTQVSIADPTHLAIYRTWKPYDNLDITDVFFTGFKAFCTDAKFGLRVLDVTDVPTEISTLPTKGTAERITLNAQLRAFIADGGGGLLMLNMEKPTEPSRIDSIQTGDSAKDIAFYGNTMYVAGGRSGLWILDKRDASTTDIPLIKDPIDTLRFCNGVTVRDTLLFVCNGKNGLKIMSIKNPSSPQMLTNIHVQDAAYDVDFDGDRAIIACGSGGLHIKNILDPRHPIDLDSVSLGGIPAKKVKVDADRRVAYVSTGAAVRVVNLDAKTVIATCPQSNNSYAVDLSENANTLYVADGTNGVQAYDVTNPGDPRLIEGMTYNTDGVASDIRMKGNAAVVADGEGTVRILDMTHVMSQSPVEVGYAHTGGSSVGLDVAGDTVAVADAEAGVYLYKTNFAGTLAALDSHLDFGVVSVGKSRTVHLNLTNTGTRVVQIRTVSSTTGRFVSGLSSTVSIYPGVIYRFPVVFYPAAVGEVTDNLTIESDAGNGALHVPVRGTGIQSTPSNAYTADYYTFLLYHMDQLKADTLVEDQSFYHLDGRNYGATLTTPDSAKFGQSALRFEGSDAIQVKLDSAVNLPAAEGFTIDTWFRLMKEQQGIKDIFRLSQSGRSLFELGVRDGGKLNNKRGLFGLTVPTPGDSIWASDTTHALQLNKWYHAALVYKSNNRMILYLNGDPLDTVEVAVSIPETSLSITIGNTGEGKSINGFLDEFRISGVARDPWEFNISTGRIQIATKPLDFGNIRIPYSRTLSLTVRNGGVGPLGVDSVRTTSSRYTVSPSSAFTLAPNESRPLWITFTPNAVETVNAVLDVHSNDPNALTTSILLSGSGSTQSTTGGYASDLYTVGLWHMDWVRGDTAITDTSTNHLTGILRKPGVSQNASFPKYGTGSLYFGSAAGWVEIPTSPAIDFANSAFSLETWFRMNSKPASGDYRVLVRRGWKNCQYEILYGDSLREGRGLVVRAYASNGQAYTLSGPPDSTMKNGAWYNVALTWDKATLRLYLNGIRADSTAFSGSLRTSSESVSVGGSYGLGRGFHGYIDEMRFSNAARLSWEFNVIGPRLLTTVQSLAFEQVLNGETASTSFQIINRGDQPLGITGLSWKNRAFTIVPSKGSIPMQISIGDTGTILVSFSPSVAGTIKDTLVIVNNDPTHATYTIPILAMVVDYRGRNSYALDDYTVALYHFDETEGVTVNDANINRHNGTLMNNTGRISDGYFSRAVRLNRIDRQYISVPQSSDLSFDMQTSGYTIECFFRTDTISQALFFKDISGGSEKPNYGLSIDNAGRLVWAGFGTGNQWIADKAWHHVALVYDNQIQRGTLYVDGSIQLQANWNSTQTDSKTSGNLVIGARETSAGNFDNYFQGDIDELRISNKARKSWEFLFAKSGIEVSLPNTPRTGVAQLVNIAVASDTSSKSVTLYYRKTGNVDYTQTAASTTDMINYRATIPAQDVVSTGLEFYVKKAYTRTGISVTQPVYDPVNKPISASVLFPSMSSELTLQAKKYAMVSVPAQLKKPRLHDVLSDELGKYDPYKWRCFVWKDSSYMEYSDSLSTYDEAEFNLTPGKTVWVITSETKTFAVDSGYSLSSAGPFQSQLKAQWNMVSSPFQFPVSWNDCALSSDSIGTLYYYDGTGYRLDWPTLEPWKGYWVYNGQTRAATIFVPPRKANTTAIPKRGVLNDLADGEWILKLSAETPEAKDLDNFVGVRNGAEESWDVFDRVEPPPIGNFVSFYVEHGDWNRHPGPYAADLRAPGEDGYVWNCRLETNLQGKPVGLNWSLYKTLPQDWVAYWVDLDEGVSLNMEEKPGCQIVTSKKNPNFRQFKILIGSPEFVEKQSDIPLQAVEFGLSQNYPNPFNPTTTIEYSLPKNGRVKLVIYNLLGQQIRVLADRDGKKGYQTVVWDGTNDRGLHAASGIYFYRLEFLDKVAVRKLVFVK